MTDGEAGTQLTLLENGAGVDDARLAELYDYPADLTRCWVRSNFVSSIDGGATTDGKSGQLGGPGDRALFSLMRELADIVIVGAGTVRTENYGGVKLGAATRQVRQNRGQAEVPPIGIVTQSGYLDRDMKVFTETEVPPLVLTATAAVPTAAERLGDSAQVIDCSGSDPDEVDIAALLNRLSGRGLHRVLTEGGPSLHGRFIEVGLLDELCLSLAPVLVGGGAGRIAAGSGETLVTMRRAHLLTDDAGYLYTRWVRR